MSGENMIPLHKIPEDSAIIFEQNPWVFYYSATENAIFIETKDYHAKPLKISKEQVFELLIKIEKVNRPVEDISKIDAPCIDPKYSEW